MKGIVLALCICLLGCTFPKPMQYDALPPYGVTRIGTAIANVIAVAAYVGIGIIIIKEVNE